TSLKARRRVNKRGAAPGGTGATGRAHKGIWLLRIGMDVANRTIRSRRLRRALAATAFAVGGVLLSVVPAVLRQDQNLGLGILYAARGHLSTPEQVVVVSVSRDSAAAVGQPTQLD